MAAIRATKEAPLRAMLDTAASGHRQWKNRTDCMRHLLATIGT